MTAIETFYAIMDRAFDVVELHRALSSVGRPSRRLSDLLRASVAFGVAGLDAYVHEMIYEQCSVLIRRKKGSELPGKLMELIKSNATHEKLVAVAYRDRPTRHIIGIVRSALEDRSFQDPGQIEFAAKLLGIEDIWRRVATELGIEERDAKLFVQPFVTRRHQIVHEGDRFLGTKRKGELRPISREYVENCLAHVGVFVLALDEVVNASN